MAQQQTSLSPQEIQVRLNQADDAMARAHTARQRAEDAVVAMTSGPWLGNKSTNFAAGFSQHIENLTAAVNKHQHLIDTARSTSTKIQQHDAEI
jgi:hypothetical protein